MNVMQDGKVLSEAIKSIANRGKILDKDIHAAAMSAAWHVMQHGNIGYVNKLFTSVSAGTRKAALTQWFLKFARVSANTGKDKATVPFVFDDAKAVNLEDGDKNPWFNLAPDKAPDQQIDVLALIHGILKKTAKEGAQVKEDQLTLVAKLQELVTVDEDAGDGILGWGA